MGCACCKPSAIDDSRESPRERVLSKQSTSSLSVVSLRREEVVPSKSRGDRDGGKVVFLDKQGNGSAVGDDFGSKREKQNYSGRKTADRGVNGDQIPHLRIGSMPKEMEGEHVAAGWPSWLAAVAGEAIKGWIPRRADSFEKLDKIGQGTYSNVYKARDIDNGKIVALKKVRFDNLEPESVRFMAREIQILRRLDHPNVIKLEGLVTSRMSCSLYLVFEYMEHDLAGLASFPGLKFTEPQVKCYMQQLLRGLDHCHSRGILHRDIKGSNLLIDNSGILKIADFGLANFFHPDQRQALTSRVVTLWYRPPELLLGATEYGVAVDLWSTGCILAELFAYKPIMPGRTEVEQLHKIFKLCGSPSEEYWRKSKLPHATIFKPQQPYRRCVAETFRDFPSPALALTDVLLSIDPADRGTAASALNSEFFTTKPLPCDPLSLPKYPPCKEFDAKVRDEEARRQRAAGGKGQRIDPERKGQRKSRAIPAPDANAELPLSMQKRQAQSNPKSKSEKFNSQQEEVASGFPIDPPRQQFQPLDEASEEPQGHSRKIASHSGPLVHPNAWAKTQRYEDDTPKMSVEADLSALSGLVAARRNVLSNNRREKNGAPLQSEYANSGSDMPDSGKEALDPTRNRDGMHHLQGQMGGNQKRDGRIGNKDQIVVAQFRGKIGRFGDLTAQTTIGIMNPGFFLNPRFQYQEGFESSDHIRSGVTKVIERLAPDVTFAIEATREGYGSIESKIHYSGPLLLPSGNVDQMLKDHERHIQEAVRRARFDKAKIKKFQAEGNHNPGNSRGPSGTQVFPSARGAI